MHPDGAGSIIRIWRCQTNRDDFGTPTTLLDPGSAWLRVLLFFMRSFTPYPPSGVINTTVGK